MALRQDAAHMSRVPLQVLLPELAVVAEQLRVPQLLWPAG